MSEIAPVPSASVNHAAYGPGANRAGGGPVEVSAGRTAEGGNLTDSERSRGGLAGKDRVDISDRARLLGKLAALPPIRQELVDHIRDQIAAGEYDTPERFDAALEQLLDELNTPT